MDRFRSFFSDKEKAAATTADVAEVAATGAKSAAATAAAVGVSLAIASGPALPVVAGVAVLVAAAARLYSKNVALNKIFAKLGRLIKDVLDVLTQIEKAKTTRKIEGLDERIESVKSAALAIQVTIGKLVGPETLQQLKLDPNVVKIDRTTWASKFARFTRMISPDRAVQELKESVNDLTLEFSILQGAFAIELEKLIPDEAKLIASIKSAVAEDIVKQNPSALNAAVESAESAPAAPVGAHRKTRRRRPRRKTRKQRFN